MRNLGDSVLPSSLALLVVNLCVVGRSPWCQNGTIPHNIGWTTWKKRPKIKFYKEYFQNDSKFGTYSGLFQIQEIPCLRTKLAYMRLEDSWSMAHIHLKKSMKKWSETRPDLQKIFAYIPPHGASFQVGNFRVTTLHAYGTKFLSNVQHVLPHIFQILMVFTSWILRWTRKNFKILRVFPRRFVLFWRKKVA